MSNTRHKILFVFVRQTTRTHTAKKDIEKTYTRASIIAATQKEKENEIVRRRDAGSHTHTHTLRN